MANLYRSRWRGVPLGRPLQRAARFCFAALNGEATTHQIAEYCRPELVSMPVDLSIIVRLGHR